MELIVGDGQRFVNPHILLWKRKGSDFEEPRVLACHGGMSILQASHVHPLFTEDGSRVLYTSDRGGYANIYLAEVGDPDDLPKLSDVQSKKE
ncbi:hypothetical protein [Paenibacillus humicola]|uniref:hypothetical protein n=1 Tax=Paenibacillus humicola TaxID=3110540 RepID=UPI00237ACC7D|nr:hypothetical protein [Paenibacillus humicola]